MFRTKLTRLFQIVLLSGMLFSHIEIASAQSTGGGQAQIVEGRAIIVRQGIRQQYSFWILISCCFQVCL